MYHVYLYLSTTGDYNVDHKASTRLRGNQACAEFRARHTELVNVISTCHPELSNQRCQYLANAEINASYAKKPNTLITGLACM
jgi:hypothetical protein